MADSEPTLNNCFICSSYNFLQPGIVHNKIPCLLQAGSSCHRFIIATIKVFYSDQAVLYPGYGNTDTVTKPNGIFPLKSSVFMKCDCKIKKCTATPALIGQEY